MEDRTSEDQVSAALDMIPALMSAARPDGTARFINKGWREYTGRVHDEKGDDGWVSAFHPEDLEKFTQEWRAIIASGEPGEAETRLRRFDGDYRRFLVRAVPQRDEQGNIVRWILRWYPRNAEIEHSHQAGPQVRHEDEELRAILNNAPILAWSCLPNGWTDFLNERWLTTFNFSWEDALGFGWAKVIHPDDTAHMLESWQACVWTGTPLGTEARFRHFDGQYRWYLNRAEPLRDETGRVVKWYGTNVDIHDLKRTEQTLRRSEAYLAQAQRLSRTGSFGWTPSTGEIHWSDESFRIFQYDRTVKPTMELALQRIHPDDRALVNQAIDEASRGQADFDIAHRLLMPDGSVKSVHVLSRAVKGAAGHLEVVGAIMDVTATKRTHDALLENERRLQAARDELSHMARVATLGHLTASITHEVSQPLGAISANAAACLRWLTRATPDIEEARAAVDRITQDVQRASTVIDRVRQLYKKTDLEKVRLDINSIIADVLPLMRREAIKSQTSIELELASGLPAALGDRVQLQQVIINLIMNGVEAMASIADGPRKLVIRSNREGVGQLVVAVQDFGSGIDPEIADKLFSPFVTTKPKGMGMGLSICRSIVDAHGGRIWASRNAGSGTTFHFTLDAAPALPSAPRLHLTMQSSEGATTSAPGHSRHFRPAKRMSVTAPIAAVIADIEFVGEVP
jgi:PAS domain S-box-containing protein